MAPVKRKETSDVWNVKVKWHFIKISALESEEINFVLWLASCCPKEELDSTCWVCAFALGAVTTNPQFSWPGHPSEATQLCVLCIGKEFYFQCTRSLTLSPINHIWAFNSGRWDGWICPLCAKCEDPGAASPVHSLPCLSKFIFSVQLPVFLMFNSTGLGEIFF